MSKYTDQKVAKVLKDCARMPLKAVAVKHGIPYRTVCAWAKGLTRHEPT